MRRVIVTGATSMVGAALVKECLKNNVETLVVVRAGCKKLKRLPKSALIKVVECDLDQIASLQIKGSFDICYHFAWAHTSKENRDNPSLQEENVRYTLDVVELAARAGCRKFIGAGSQAEYGSVGHLITPDTPADPQTAYGAAKYAAGILSRKLCAKYGMMHIWGRIFSVYGKNDNEGTMLSYAIGQFLKGEPAMLSAATQMWDYLYEDDAGKIFYRLGEYAKESKIYCIANGAYRPLKEFITEMTEVFGQGAQCEFAPEKDPPAAGLQPDVSALRKDIAYWPQTTFKEGIKKMIEQKRKMCKGGGRRRLNNLFPALERRPA